MRTISEAFSDIGEDCYIDLYQYLLQTWIHSSTGEWIDFHGTVWSQARKAGAKATCSNLEITINAQEATFTLPAGTIVSTNEPTPRYYETISEVVIDPGDTTGNTSIRAVAIGEAYNAPVHYISSIIDVAGIVKVDNLVEITGGEDAESDTDYIERFLLYVREGLARATEGALEYGAKTVSGITSAKVKKNLPNHWETYPYLKLKYSGIWEEVADDVYYYGARKAGTGKAWLYFWGSKIKVALWKGPDYGECTYHVDNATPVTIDLHATALTKTVIEINFATEGYHHFELDTGANSGSVESIDVLANYLGTNFIFIDDGTGATAWSLVKEVYAEMENWVSAEGQYFVKRCEKKFVDINIQIQVTEGVAATSILSSVENAVIAYINTLKMGETLYISQLNKTILGVANVVNCIVQSTDIVPLDYEIIRPHTIGVSLV
jgi:uncharacterized phage protein gp47/JayE